MSVLEIGFPLRSSSSNFFRSAISSGTIFMLLSLSERDFICTKSKREVGIVSMVFPSSINVCRFCRVPI